MRFRNSDRCGQMRTDEDVLTSCGQTFIVYVVYLQSQNSFISPANVEICEK